MTLKVHCKALPLKIFQAMNTPSEISKERVLVIFTTNLVDCTYTERLKLKFARTFAVFMLPFERGKSLMVLGLDRDQTWHNYGEGFHARRDLLNSESSQLVKQQTTMTYCQF